MSDFIEGRMINGEKKYFKGKKRRRLFLPYLLRKQFSTDADALKAEGLGQQDCLHCYRQLFPPCTEKAKAFLEKASEKVLLFEFEAGEIKQKILTRPSHSIVSLLKIKRQKRGSGPSRGGVPGILRVLLRLPI